MQLSNKPFVTLSLVVTLVAAGPFNSATASTSVSPTPTVVGNTIQVAEDGWYQFQRATDFEEVCAGTFSCTVAPGNYLVVNHTTGQRWNPVTVPGDESPEIDEPQVNGNRIDLPDNGWYQVQDKSNFDSLCEGVAFCDVPAGTYVVINHTTGTRYEPIIISNDDLPPDNEEPPGTISVSAERYSISAGELFWQRDSSDSQYHVFRDDIFLASVTGSSYFDNTLPENASYRYEIIQLDTGNSGIVMLEKHTFTEPDRPELSPLLNNENALNILASVIGVINEDQIDTFFADANTDGLFRGRLLFISNTSEEIIFSQGVRLDEPYQKELGFGTGTFISVPFRGEYTCERCGTLYLYDNDRVFNDCVVGAHTYSGTTGRRNDQMRGVISTYPFYSFSSTDTAGVTSTLSGGYHFGNTSFLNLDLNKGW